MKQKYIPIGMMNVKCCKCGKEAVVAEDTSKKTMIESALCHDCFEKYR